MPQFVFLWTDVALFAMVLLVLIYAFHVWRTPTLRSTWRRVAHDAPAMCSAVILSAFLFIGLLDSIHFRPQLPVTSGESTPGESTSGESTRGESTPGESTPGEPGPVRYSPIVRSALDAALANTTLTQTESRFSKPLAVRQFDKESVLTEGGSVREYKRLVHGGAHLADPDAPRTGDIFKRIGIGSALGLVFMLVPIGIAVALVARRRASLGEAVRDILANDTSFPVRPMLITTIVLFLVAGGVAGAASGYHVLGTDQTGNDVLYQALRSIRTAIVIGSLTTVAMLPPALILGISAGYFKGKVDDVIQYIYTTLTSIPSVLLVAACVLLLQTYIDTHPEQFPTSAHRADLRLFLLCMILGLTGWASLCRLLRAETLKLRELEYIQAAKAFGVSHWKVMLRHILPNVMHIVLITVVLEFSALVLYEAVLSYLGIGVDPSMNSFGSMIDASRLDMSRDPMVWWSLLTAFVFMLTLVLSANLFADAVRAAFDPRSRMFRVPRRRRALPASPATAQSPAEGRTPS